jgi:hypothetical protein
MTEPTNELIDLSDVTFLIPIRIDSPERLQNAQISIPYLFKHFRTNLILMEVDDHEHQELKFAYPGFIYRYLAESGIFHRTRYLNLMLREVQTPVVVVHDIDVILPVPAYVQARDKILQEGYVMWHPFANPPGVILLTEKTRLQTTLDWEVVMPDHLSSLNKLKASLPSIEHLRLTYHGKLNVSVPAGAGFTCWFQTAVYRWAGAENEQFVSYGPEDQERFFRFIALDCKVTPYKGSAHNALPSYPDASPICHLEHPRGKDSSPRNPCMTANVRLHQQLTSYTKSQIKDYYQITGEPPLLPIPYKIDHVSS